MSHKSEQDRLQTNGKLARMIAGGLLSVVIISIIGFLIAVQCTRRPFSPPGDSDRWQTGDIFFSVGNTWRSLVVRLFDGDNSDGLTHCGFIMVDGGEPRLVHMSTEKNQIARESIEEYAGINNVNRIIVKRLKVPVDTTMLRHRILTLLSMPKEFDNGFNHHDTSQYYCTEFVVKELGKAGCHEFDYLLDNEYIYPVDLADLTDVFKTISE